MGRLLKKNSLLKLINGYAYDSLLPSNLNYFYNIGSLLALILGLQIVTGFFFSHLLCGRYKFSF